MLYESPKSFDDLVKNGCKVMVYGHDSFKKFQEIFDSLVEDEKVMKTVTGSYSLPTKSIYEIKKNTILPSRYLSENPKYHDAFVQTNREKCDIEFLEHLSRSNNEHEVTDAVKHYSQQYYLGVAKILEQIGIFRESNPNFQPTFQR